MSEYNQYPYISSLDSLNDLEPFPETTYTQEELDNALARWTETQFTFDMPPDVRAHDTDDSLDLSTLEQPPHQTALLPSLPLKFEPLDALDSTANAITFDDLTYLNCDVEPSQTQDHATLPSAAVPSSKSRNDSVTNAQLSASFLEPLLLAPASAGKRGVANNSAQNFFTPHLVPRLVPTIPLLAKQLAPAPALAPASAPASISAPPASAPANPKKRLSIAQHPDPLVASPAVTIATATASAAATITTIAASDSDASSKIAAEEDKRRRNTAASARFRVKKKQREQALERTAREMTAKADMLGHRVQELERENRWLQGLLVNKVSRSKQIAVAGGEKEEMAAKRVKVDKEVQ